MTTTTKLTSFHSQPVVVTVVHSGKGRMTITDAYDYWGKDILPILSFKEKAELENQIAEELK